MKKCTFSYKPTYLFLSASNSLDEVKMKIIGKWKIKKQNHTLLKEVILSEI